MRSVAEGGRARAEEEGKGEREEAPSARRPDPPARYHRPIERMLSYTASAIHFTTTFGRRFVLWDWLCICRKTSHFFTFREYFYPRGTSDNVLYMYKLCLICPLILLTLPPFLIHSTCRYYIPDQLATLKDKLNKIDEETRQPCGTSSGSHVRQATGTHKGIFTVRVISSSFVSHVNV